MPRLKIATPKYRRHRASGQAVVTLNGRDFYLGIFKSKESLAEYDRLVGGWQANGRRAPQEVTAGEALTIDEMLLEYWTYVKMHYRKNGRPTTEQDCIRSALRHLTRLYGPTPAKDFGPLALKTVRQAMINTGLSRGVVNANVGRIKRYFRWAVENELVGRSVRTAYGY